MPPHSNQQIHSKLEENQQDDYSDEENEDNATDNMDDDGTEEEEEEEEEEDTPKQKTIIDYIDEIVDEEWSGNMEKDVESIREAFHKYLLSIGILKTKFFKQFQQQLQEEMRTLKMRYTQDGVSKDEREIEQTAYDETFDSFIPRIEDILQELYRQLDIQEVEATTSGGMNYHA